MTLTIYDNRFTFLNVHICEIYTAVILHFNITIMCITCIYKPPTSLKVVKIPGNDPPLCSRIRNALHSKWFAAACLAICKYCSIIALSNTLQSIQRQCKDWLNYYKEVTKRWEMKHLSNKSYSLTNSMLNMTGKQKIIYL